MMDAADKVADIRRYYIERQEQRFSDFVNDIAVETESPIEEVFGAALFAVLADIDSALPYFTFWTGSPPDGLDDFVAVQVPMAGGKYRADFFVACTKKDGSQFGVVIECDGHDSHERTKEQAKHDRQRDRWVQAAGLYVLRFTGSEIWQDPFRCAREVQTFLHHKRFE